MSSNVLTERDTNAQPLAAKENQEPEPVEYDGQMLVKKLSDQKSEKAKAWILIEEGCLEVV